MWKKIWNWLSGNEADTAEADLLVDRVHAKKASTKKPAAKKPAAKKPAAKKATVKKTATKKPSLPSVKTADLTAMTKKAMDEYAEGFGIKLDRRKTKAAMIEQLKTHTDKIKVS